jgi:hypothetical protein
MDTSLTEIARTCLDGAETGTVTFAQIVGTPTREGFDSYAIEFRRGTATFLLPDGDSGLFPIHRREVPIADALDVASVQTTAGRSWSDAGRYAAVPEAGGLRPDRNGGALRFN